MAHNGGWYIVSFVPFFKPYLSITNAPCSVINVNVIIICTDVGISKPAKLPQGHLRALEHCTGLLLGVYSTRVYRLSGLPGTTPAPWDAYLIRPAKVLGCTTSTVGNWARLSPTRGLCVPHAEL